MNCLDFLLYLPRLDRLLRLGLRYGYSLSFDELKKLRSKAIVSTVGALTELKAGNEASELLREAHRSQQILQSSLSLK